MHACRSTLEDPTAIASTGAERVFVTHGQVEPLVRYLREQGLDARPMETEFQGEKGAEEGGTVDPGAAASDAEENPGNAGERG